jgi:hypothetical protein
MRNPELWLGLGITKTVLLTSHPNFTIPALTALTELANVTVLAVCRSWNEGCRAICTLMAIGLR